MRHTGHTLLEMMLSLTLLAIISVSVGSAVLLASKGTPDEDSPAATLLNDSRVLARIAEDLAMARHVSEHSANAVTIVVADRTGDGLPDRVRYAWSGVAGEPLTCELNEGSPAALIDRVDQFALSVQTSSRVVSIPSAGTSDGPETLLSAHEATPIWHWSITDDRAVGHRFTPTLSTDAVGYKVTRAQMTAYSSGATTGEIPISIKDISGDTPGSTIYATQTLLESSLTANFGDWFEVTFASSRTVPAGQEAVLEFGLGVGSGTLANIAIADTGSVPYVYTEDGGDDWYSESGEYLPYRVYGVEVLPDDGYDLTLEHVRSVTIELQSAAEGRSPISRMVLLEQAPEVMTQFWEADFEANPTGYDLNNDGTDDWLYNRGSGKIPDSALVDGAWQSSSLLAVAPTGTLPSVVRVHVRLLAGGGDQATLYGPFDSDGGGDVLPLVVVLQEDGVGGQELLFYNEQTPKTPFATIGSLSDDWIDLELTLLPNEQVLYVVIDGEERGSASLAMEADQGSRGFWLEGSGSGAQFSEVSVMYGGSYTINPNAPVMVLGD